MSWPAWMFGARARVETNSSAAQKGRSIHCNLTRSTEAKNATSRNNNASAALYAAAQVYQAPYFRHFARRQTQVLLPLAFGRWAWAARRHTCRCTKLDRRGTATKTSPIAARTASIVAGCSHHGRMKITTMPDAAASNVSSSPVMTSQSLLPAAMTCRGSSGVGQAQ